MSSRVGATSFENIARASGSGCPRFFCYVATGALRDSLRPSRIASPQDRPEGLAQKQCGIDRSAASWFALEAPWRYVWASPLGHRPGLTPCCRPGSRTFGIAPKTSSCRAAPPVSPLDCPGSGLKPDPGDQKQKIGSQCNFFAISNCLDLSNCGLRRKIPGN